MLITGKAVKERLKTGRPLPSFFACLGRSDLRVRLRRQREFERTKERSKRREKIKVPGSEWSIIPLYELYRGDDHSFFSVKVIFTTTPESLPEKLRVLEIGKQRAVSDSDFAESELSIISVPGDQQPRREKEMGKMKDEDVIGGKEYKSRSFLETLSRTEYERWAPIIIGLTKTVKKGKLSDRESGRGPSFQSRSGF